MDLLTNLRYKWDKKIILIIIILAAIFFLPLDFAPFGISISSLFVKQRVVGVGILFLVLRGLIHDYYTPFLTILFLITLILAPTFTFGQLVIGVLFGFIILKILKKM